VIIYGSPYSNLKYLEGTIPFGVSQFSVKGSMSDPAYYCAYLFNEFLESKNIITKKTPSTVRILSKNENYHTKARKTFYTHKSPQLSSILKLTNQKSINSFAEACLKMCGVKMYSIGSTKKGIDAITNFWVSKGVAEDGLIMKDGSGLSRLNLITTKQMVNMLYAYTKEPSFQDFYNSLAVGGKSGSISSLFIGTNAENNLRAKSGYMTGIRAFSGYVNNKKDEQIIFSIIVNNYSGSPYSMKKKLERLMIKISEL
ncbi:MAG: D-alanyl-D-alanine carboxypeptidase/D-alanyl-D-alanine-endopeptidase, partial [Bacteroidetes bacterium]|nr:D-alanyl-D-alanine carboxypeptidase/D-alanyl-D-alanine-endopeptidase [Bacteroidota bacterium]